MDLYSNIWAINHSPDRVRAKMAKRARRQREIHQHIGAAVSNTQNFQAAIRWNQKPRNPDGGAGEPIGLQHPGQAAIVAVRQALAEFHIPTEIETRFAGMHRFSGRGGHKMEDGVIVVEATLHSLSGINRVIDIPVQVREGCLLEPGVVIDRGIVRAMTQHTFDDLLEQGTFHMTIPDRQHMFSPPPDERSAPRQTPLVRPGLFGVSPTSKMLTRAFVKSAMSGHYAVELPNFAQGRQIAHQDRSAQTAPHLYGDMTWGGAPSHRDRAEMPQNPIQAGDKVSLNKEVAIAGRDGLRFTLTKGTEGQVQRDMEGDGRFYYVFFPDAGYAARVPGAYLSR